MSIKIRVHHEGQLIFQQNEMYYDSNFVGHLIVSPALVDYKELLRLLRSHFSADDIDTVYVKNYLFCGGSEFWLRVHADGSLKYTTSLMTTRLMSSYNYI